MSQEVSADPKITDRELGALGVELERRGIAALSLRGCEHVSNTGLFHLALSMRGLRWLDLTGTQVTLKGLQPVGPHLHTLRFHHLEVDRDEFAGLLSLMAVEVLDLSHVRAPRVTRWDRLRGQTWEGPDYAELARLWRLRTLVLHGARLSAEDLAALGKVAGLSSLDLSEATGVSDEDVLHLAQLPHLARLDLSGTAVTDVGAARLQAQRGANLPRLAVIREQAQT